VREKAIGPQRAGPTRRTRFVRSGQVEKAREAKKALVKSVRWSGLTRSATMTAEDPQITQKH
jgi:hypothetical protein